jgi:hypothetical protein
VAPPVDGAVDDAATDAEPTDDGVPDAEPTDDGVTDAELVDAEAEAADGAGSAFVGLVAEYAIRLERGEPPALAFAAALGDSVWEPAAP